MDEAQFEGTVSESDLHKAQQALVTPRLRLAAELGWLPELSQAQIEKIFDRRLTLSSGMLLSSVEMLPELARANLIADLCGRQATGVDVVNALMASWDALDNSSVFDFLGSGRKASGFSRLPGGEYASTYSGGRRSRRRGKTPARMRSSL
ncbi:hypothetical protein ILFOPFJJ_06589 [Ensifer psoraleae]|uniref:hypothetical protein n=1 Tax=Sinorhizobium psoraleae TaxID=520838 RepID=UPI0015680E87|nr:hypothetical protein [Sinorhizobium psoraleae]NRP75666.1 hypothetical protein [Sinorhizobium psoraleae]